MRRFILIICISYPKLLWPFTVYSVSPGSFGVHWITFSCSLYFSEPWRLIQARVSCAHSFIMTCQDSLCMCGKPHPMTCDCSSGFKSHEIYSGQTSKILIGDVMATMLEHAHLHIHQSSCPYTFYSLTHLTYKFIQSIDEKVVMVPGTRQAEHPLDGEGAAWWNPHQMAWGLLVELSAGEWMPQ